MVSISVPPAANYSGKLNAVPDFNTLEPKEGRKLISVEIDWTVTDNGLGCVAFNLSNNATLEFSKVSGLIVDNSACGADIQFIFPDTGTTLSVPAYEPYAVLPVYSNQTQFFVEAVDKDLATDITRFTILNYTPAPVVAPTTNHQNIGIADDVPVTNGTTVILANTISGTIEALSVQLAMNSAAGGYVNAKWVIQDGTGLVVATGRVVGSFGATINGLLLNLQNVAVRFSQGLSIVFSGDTIGQAFVDVVTLYRQP